MSSASKPQPKPHVSGMSRRAFLVGCWALAGTVLFFLAKGIASFLGFRGAEAETRHRIPRPSEYPFHGPGFWLDRDARGVFAFLDRCTHLGCTPVYDSSQELFVCPCHGSRFARGGRVVSGPARRDMERIRVSETDDGGLMVDLTEKVSGEYRIPP